jgi:Pyruvate/2-oxoacid:ferredoxin oxidoreductase delta subunit
LIAENKEFISTLMNVLLLIKRILLFVMLVFLVVLFSNTTQNVWGNHEESENKSENLRITAQMTVSDYGHLNKIPLCALINIFSINQLADTNKHICNFNYDRKEILKRSKVEIAKYKEEHSKNPVRYSIHFIIAVIFMAVVFYLLGKSKINPALRKYLYIISIVIFGIGFNSNPSPMGPLKDTISLLGNLSEIVHPRLFAILTYLIIVVIANKFICSWVCQFGVLQDLIFRLNRNTKDNEGIIKQIKLPFVFSNSIRIIFFVTTVCISFFWAINIIDSINPFAVFAGSGIQIAGWSFVGIILILSFFTYRPWCHLFCPFGLLSWLFEMVSIYKIRVNYKTCTACDACVKGCPSETMSAVLAQKKIRPDCFSCGTCISECPTGSVKYCSKNAL